MNLSVKLVTIPVTDQDRALAFYRDKLGFSLKVDAGFAEGMPRWIQLSAPSGGSDIVLMTAPGHEDRIGTFNPICFGTSDIEKTYEELVARGVEMADSITHESWGSYFVLRDPDDNKILVGTDS